MADAGAINFLNPYFFIRIGDNKTKEIRSFAPVGHEEKGDFGRFLTGVSVTEGPEGNSKMSATLTPTREYALGPNGLLNDSILALGNTLEIQWGYPSLGMRKAYSILTVPSIEISDTGIDITLNAEGVLFGMMRRESGKVWTEDPTDPLSPGLTPLQIIEKIGKKMGFILGKNLEVITIDNSFEESPSKILVQHESDWEFLKKIAKAYNAEAFMSGNILFIAVRDATYLGGGEKKAEVKATFRMFGQLDIPNNVYPLLSFSAEQAGTVLSMSAIGAASQGIEPDSGETIIDKAEHNKIPSVTKNITAGDRKTVKSVFPELQEVLIDKAFEKGETGKSLYLSERLEKRSESLQAVLNNAALEVLETSIETIGVPFIKPKNLIAIEGVGKLFDKIYDTHEITHTLGSGYAMSIDLKSASMAIESELDNTVKPVTPRVVTDPNEAYAVA